MNGPSLKISWAAGRINSQWRCANRAAFHRAWRNPVRMGGTPTTNDDNNSNNKKPSRPKIMRNVLAGHCRRMALSDDLSLKDILDILKFIPYNYVIPYNSLECHVTYSYVYINNVCVYIYICIYKYIYSI